MDPKTIFRTVQKTIVDNSPGILTGLGVAGTVTTAVLTGKAAYSSALKIAAANEVSIGDMKGELEAKEKLELVWKEFIPPAAAGLVTIVAIIGANQIGSRRAAAFAAAYKLSEQLSDDYKKKVVETLGLQKEEKMRSEIAAEKMEANPPSPNMLIVAGANALFYDELSGRYFHNTMDAVQRAVNEINYQVNNYYCASLTEFYDRIGLEATKYSDSVGWNSDRLLDPQYTGVLLPGGTQSAIMISYNEEPIKGYERCQ